MLEGSEEGTGSEELTLTAAAALFESSLADAPVETEDDAKPPTQESPASEPDEAEASSEQAEAEGESPENEESVEEDTPEPEAPRVHKVTVDGDEVEVTEEELLKGYSRTADYTRKTMKLAEERKAIEARDAELAGERARLSEHLKTLEEAIKAQTPKEPNWHEARATMEPAEFAALYAEWQHHKESVKQIEVARKEAEEAVQRDRQKAIQQHVEAQREILTQRFPELKDTEKGKAKRAEWVAAAESVGFTREELNNAIPDARLFELLDKAARWDALQKQKPTIQQKIEKVKAATPGSKNSVTPKKQTPKAEAAKRLASSGSLTDAAAFYYHSEA